jgi:transposase
LEEVKKKENYLGERIKRGLFRSAIGKKLNADLNGAINIMRKVKKLEEIKGEKIMNPKVLKIITPLKIKLSCDVDKKPAGKGIIGIPKKCVKLI